MGRRRVLVVEDDALLRRSLARHLSRQGCEVAEAENGTEAIALLDQDAELGLVISDLEMPHAGGREVLQHGLRRKIPVVILTGNGSIETAVEMMRQGAANFLTKPFSSDALREVLDQAFGKRETTAVAASGEPVIGQAPGFRRVVDTVGSFADSDAAVLITGESGTGKEVVARLIHANSRRAEKPFVAVNCGALPDALLESEMFGHARGAFTGATHARAGRFQIAEGGTLFLDEIGDMPLTFQVKLLRVLQEKQFEILGENTLRKTDVRIISATHRDLPALIESGEFREDLYYRLNVIDLRLPSLRERREDIPLLVTHLIGAANARHHRSVTGASPALLERLATHRFPGNIRELSNLVERLVVVKRAGELDVDDLGPGLAPPPSLPTRGESRVALPEGGVDLRQALADFEASLIAQALDRTGGNRNAAANLLGLNRTTLVEKLKRKQ